MVEKTPQSEITYDRFLDAQKSESALWHDKQDYIKSDEHRHHKRKAVMDILNELEGTTDNGKLNRFLEIGGGPDPMTEYFQGRIGIAIDPLAPTYKAKLFPDLLKSVEYYCAVGEHLPFKSDVFDGVLLYNVIDHGIAPFKIIDEGKRVLRKGGAMHMLLDTYSRQFYVLRKFNELALQKRRRDEQHPHKLSFSVVEKYIKDSGFVEVKSYHDSNPYHLALTSTHDSLKILVRDVVRGHRALRAFYRLQE
jgi:SAM-dependent methyltransferase